jgi:hypothetical protein
MHDVHKCTLTMRVCACRGVCARVCVRVHIHTCRQALWDQRADGRLLPHTEKMVVENFSEYEKQYVYMKPAKQTSLRLNRDHSHFILVDDGSVGKFGGESACRSGFEDAMNNSDYESYEAVRDSLVRQNMGWQRTKMGHDFKWRSGGSDCKDNNTTSICIVVQGGLHTVQKALEAVRNGTPVLLVKGSGQTADLLADATEFTQKMRHKQGLDRDDDFDRTSSEGSNSSFSSFMSDFSNATVDSSGSRQQRWELIQRLITNDPDDEWLQADVQKCYGISYQQNFDQVVDSVTEIAQSGLIQVFDIEKSQTTQDYVDMSGAMLLCALKKEIMKGKQWHECLALVVQWNHEQILRQVLRKVNITAGPVKNAFEKAFHDAFLHNKVGLCKHLLEYGDVSCIYDVRRKPTITGVLVTAGFNMLRKVGLESAGYAGKGEVLSQWSRIVMKLLTREELNGCQVSPEHRRWGDLFDHAMHVEEVMKLEKWANAATGGWSTIVVSSISSYDSGNPEAKAEAEAVDHGLAYVDKQKLNGKAKRKGADSREAMLAFHGMYKYVMGENWWYEASTLGPDFDMFLWSLLMMREEMAKLIWMRLDFPVRSALLAAALYRKWSVLPDIKPHVQMQMNEMALRFEDLAVEVQKIAMRKNPKWALMSLERKSRLWKGQTAVDLALLGSCHTFLVQCCSQALDYRWSGDLHPYNQTLGLYPSVILCLFTGGLLAPQLLTYRSPPPAEAIRPPTQRIRIPEKRRLDENSSEALDTIFYKLQKVQASSAISYDSREVREFTSDDLEDMASNHVVHEESVSWTERFNLFFLCPITIFMMDAIVQITINIAFMRILFTSDLDRQTLTTLELALAALQLSTTICELAQAYIEGYQNYSQTGMNWVKMLGLGFFWLGFGGHWLRSLSTVDGLHPMLGHMLLVLKAVGVDEHTELLYSLSLFFMWMLVLNIISVRKDLGPLVSVFGRMGSDMLTFGAIWIILLVGFSCAMHGTGINDDRPECLVPPAGVGEAASERSHVLPMSCWSTWWILRTYYQAFGQPFFEELKTDQANVITIILWPVMNLMLVNLLIAIMNDSYSFVKQQSKLEWMIKMFNMAKEYRSPSRLNVVMLTHDFIVYLWTKKDVDSRLNKLIGQRMPGWKNYLEDLRIKFRKFQCRDLPAVDIAQQKKKIEAAIEMLGQDDSEEAFIDARVIRKIKNMFHKELSRALLEENLRKQSQRKNRILRSTHGGGGEGSAAEAVVLAFIYFLVRVVSLVALPITWPLSVLTSGGRWVQEIVTTRKVSKGERAELRNDLIRQLWILSKVTKTDTEVLTCCIGS